MAKVTVGCGLVLIVLGVVFFVTTGSYAPTSLIPAFFGVALGLCGWLANTEDAKKRMLFMHIAVTIGLLGFLFPGFRALRDGIRLAKGETLLRPAAFEEQAAMAVLMLIYVVLCVRSFIAARKGRIVAA